MSRRRRPGSRVPGPGVGTGGTRGTNLDEFWSRAGARNVAGVTYQVAVTAHLLVSGRAGDLPVTAVTPEGIEDIDCRLAAGSRLLVQAKDRGAGDGRFGAKELTAALHRVSPALLKNRDARFALVTDAELATGLPETGWHATLAGCLPGPALEKLAVSLEDLSPEVAQGLLHRTHVVRLPWNLGPRSASLLAEALGLAPAVARLVLARLLEDLARVASEQRTRSPSDATTRKVSDLDALARRVLEVVDASELDAAVRAGIVEPLDFTLPEELSPERFLAGVDVHPGHVAGNLDLPRPRELAQIYEGLRGDRYALIVGPSGSGKSALLWRAAHDVEGLVRPARVRRLLSEDVPDLLRWIRLQEPSPTVPLLVCGDDLGRPTMAGWTEAVRGLLEIPGVLVLGAARQEDFRPELALGRARVVEPTLDATLAQAIATTLTDRGIATRLAPEEAIAASEGLLMEFLSLLIAGRRLEDVVTAQVDQRLAPERRTEREILRYVCSAHVVGLSLPAERLPELLGQVDLSEALEVLRNEHLITTDDRARWVGLHELRSEVISRRLHALPPPTEAATFASLLPQVPPDERRHLIVRYAMRPSSILEPIADSVADLLRSGRVSAAEAAELLEALEEADSVRYAQACLAVVEEMGERRVDPYDLLSLAYYKSLGRMELPLPLPAVDAVADRLPERPPSARQRAAAVVRPVDVRSLAVGASSAEAARLLESLEGALAIGTEDARAIWQVHRAAPVALRARLIASLVRLSGVQDEKVATLFGSLEDRLRALVEDHPNGIAWNVKSDSDEGVVATVRLLAPASGDSAHTQAVECAELMLACCPEADVAEVVTLDPDGKRHHFPGHEPAHKRIPRANLPRDAETRPNAKFLDAVRRLLAARYWTDRLRQQARIAAELDALAAQIPDRLCNPHDNARRRREWVQRVASVRQAISAIPPPPIPDLDRTTPDPAKRGLDLVATALGQLAGQFQADFPNLVGIASQLRNALPDLAAGRAAGAPTLASVGDPLPEDLRQRVRAASDLLFLPQRRGDASLPPRRPRQSWWDYACELVDRARAETLARERQVLESTLRDAGVAAEVRLVPHLDPNAVQLVTDRWVVLVPVEAWPQGEALLSLPEADRRQLAFRTYLLPSHNGEVVPVLGARLGVDRFWPIERADVETQGHDADIPLRRTQLLDGVEGVVAALGEASRCAALIRLRGDALPREAQRAAASASLEEARALIETLDHPGVTGTCQELLGHVEAELSGQPPDLGLAAAMVAAVRDGVVTPLVEAANEIVLVAAGLDRDASGA